MTVGELKQFLEDVDDDLPVVTREYNDGYGGMFDAGWAVVQTKPRDAGGYEEYYEGDAGLKVLGIGPGFG